MTDSALSLNDLIRYLDAHKIEGYHTPLGVGEDGSETLIAIIIEELAEDRKMSAGEVRQQVAMWCAMHPSTAQGAKPKLRIFPEMKESDRGPVDAARTRVGADVRRIGLGILELWDAGCDYAERRVRDRTEGAMRAVRIGISGRLLDPAVVRLVRLAARLDGGPMPEQPTREAIAKLIFGPDPSGWPGWVTHKPATPRRR